MSGVKRAGVKKAGVKGAKNSRFFSKQWRYFLVLIFGAIQLLRLQRRESGGGGGVDTDICNCTQVRNTLFLFVQFKLEREKRCIYETNIFLECTEVQQLLLPIQQLAKQ